MLALKVKKRLGSAAAIVSYLLLLGLGGALENSAYAFPNLVRHGYSQCTACHISPSGGGTLTSYGRQLSAEVLSTWSAPDETSPLYSPALARLAEKGLMFGGDIRSVQTHHEDENVKEGKFFLMQAAAELAYIRDHFSAVVSVGEIQKPQSGIFRGDFFSTKYYGLLQITDEWAVRAGRFTPNFGINYPDHIMVTREAMGIGPSRQFDTVETNYFTEHWSLYLGATQTQPYTRPARQEKAWVGTVAYNFSERYKVGVSYWNGRQLTNTRNATSLFGVLGFTSHFYNMTEIDVIGTPGKQTLAGLTQIAYEVHKGITPYFQYQHLQTDLNASNTLTRHYGLGFYFFPRPHLELSAQWDRILTGSTWSDEAYVLGHFYF